MRTERLALERLREELAALRTASADCLADLEEAQREATELSPAERQERADSLDARRLTCEALVARHNALADSVRRVMAARAAEEG